MLRSVLLGLVTALALAFSAPASTPAPAPAARSAFVQDGPIELSLNIVPLSEVVLDARDYCPKDPTALWCIGDGGKDAKLTLAEVQDLDVKLRSTYHEQVDTKIEQTGAYWRESTTGDCKTYALTLAQRLAAAGEGSKNMSLMLSLPDPNEAHMTLVVDTADQGLVEIGDESGGEPHPFEKDHWVRLAYSPLDGRQLWYMVVSPAAVALTFGQAPMDNEHLDVWPSTADPAAPLPKVSK